VAGVKRFITVGIIFGFLLAIVVAISWFLVPGWQSPTSGGFWVLLGVAAIGVISFVRSAVAIWKDLREGGDKSSSIILPRLQLSLVDKLGQYVDELAFSQRANNQDFHFGVALVNTIAGSLPAEKFNNRRECSLSGANVTKAPKFRVDTQDRTTQNWNVSREFIQQGDKPYPAVISFHGSADDRCSYNHPLEWHGFSVVLAERMEGKFLLNYKISGANPRVEFENTLAIHVDSGEFGTKSAVINDMRTGEKLHIELNSSTGKFLINGVRVTRQRDFERNKNELVFAPANSASISLTLYCLSSEQIEQIEAM